MKFAHTRVLVFYRAARTPLFFATMAGLTGLPYKKAERLVSEMRKLDGTIVTIESKASGEEGKFIAAVNSNLASITKGQQGAATQFLVHYVQSDFVAFESVKFPGHYLDLKPQNWINNYRWIRISRAKKGLVPSLATPWCVFTVRGGKDLNNVLLNSMNFKDRQIAVVNLGGQSRLVGRIIPGANPYINTKYVQQKGYKDWEIMASKSRFAIHRVSKLWSDAPCTPSYRPAQIPPNVNSYIWPS